MADLHVTIRTATEHGWLRRGDLDTDAGHAWELPDGKLVLIERGRTPQVASLRFSQLTDADREYLAWYAAKQRGQ